MEQLNQEKLEEKIKETSKEFNKADGEIKEISSEIKKYLLAKIILLTSLKLKKFI
ncbi:MAG: hypothetical protein R3Y29_08395 [bacterium]